MLLTLRSCHCYLVGLDSEIFMLLPHASTEEYNFTWEPTPPAQSMCHAYVRCATSFTHHGLSTLLLRCEIRLHSPCATRM